MTQEHNDSSADQQSASERNSEKQAVNGKSFTNEKSQQRPAVGPQGENYERLYNHTSYHRQDWTEEEIAQRQTEWQSLEEKNEQPVVYDFPNYFFAGFWIRLFAFLIDLICINAIATILLSWFRLDTAGSMLSPYRMIGLIIYLSYFTGLTKLNQGQTIGKMIFGIRVICFDERELSWATVLVRETACRFILKILFIGYIPTIFSGKKQHAGDYFSNTSVVTLNTISAFNKKVRASS